MEYAYKASKYLRNIKFGVEVPQSTRHAFKIDEEDGKELWKKAMETEINQLMEYETFRVLEDDEPCQKDISSYPTIVFMMSSLMAEGNADL